MERNISMFNCFLPLHFAVFISSRCFCYFFSLLFFVSYSLTRRTCLHFNVCRWISVISRFDLDNFSCTKLQRNTRFKITILAMTCYLLLLAHCYCCWWCWCRLWHCTLWSNLLENLNASPCSFLLFNASKDEKHSGSNNSMDHGARRTKKVSLLQNNKKRRPRRRRRRRRKGEVLTKWRFLLPSSELSSSFWYCG